MIKADKITFETAVLAHKKGLRYRKIDCVDWYNEITKSINTIGYVGDQSFSDYYKNVSKVIMSAPTQNLMIEWLWSKHKIQVNVIPSSIGTEIHSFWYNYQILKFFKNKVLDYSMWSEKGYSSRKKAIEEGIKKALNLIK